MNLIENIRNPVYLVCSVSLAYLVDRINQIDQTN